MALDLKDIVSSVNIASELDDQKLIDIGNRVVNGFKADEDSMAEWLSDVKRVEELASLHSRKKSTPLPNSANVKLPIITKACYEFSSTTYPEIVKDDRVVQAYIIGKDVDGTKSTAAKKVTEFMNFQLLIDQQDWELDLNRLLVMLALVGFVCKKTYYDPVCDKIKSIMCDPKELIINSNSKSLEDAPRISQILHLRLNDLIEKKNKKVNKVPVFLEAPVKELEEQSAGDYLDKPIDLIEQHCKLDLDEDGYSEPYIVTVIKDSGKVLRIVARYTKEDIHKEDGRVCYITPIKCFVDFHFLPSPKGKFQSVGFGLLLLHLTDSANSCINQLLDAAQLSNMRGGYRDARLKIIASGNSLHDPGEWKDVKVQTGATLKDGLLPIDYKEPSSVMYQLLGLLIDVSRDLTSSAEINNGTQSSENAKTGATIALQNEGKKMVNSINKGLYRSLTVEFRQLFALNGLYLDKYTKRNISTKQYNVGAILEVSQDDFDVTKVTMYPVADPSLSSAQQKLANAQTILSFMQAGLNIDRDKATKFILAQTNIPDIEALMPDPNQPAPPNPEAIKIQADIQNMSETNKLKAHELDLRGQELELQSRKVEAEIKEIEASAVEHLAKASSEDTKHTLQDLKIQIDALLAQQDKQVELAKMQHEKETQALAQQHEARLQQSDQAHQQQLADQQAQQEAQNAQEGSGTLPE